MLYQFSTQVMGKLYIQLSEMLADEVGLNYFELFQLDKTQNRKGLIAINLMEWEP